MKDERLKAVAAGLAAVRDELAEIRRCNGAAPGKLDDVLARLEDERRLLVVLDEAGQYAGRLRRLVAETFADLRQTVWRGAHVELRRHCADLEDLSGVLERLGTQSRLLPVLAEANMEIRRLRIELDRARAAGPAPVAEVTR